MKFQPLEMMLATRYLSSVKGRGLSVITWIALSGVAVGVMSLVAVIAVMSGFEKELRTKILGNNAHIIIKLDSFSNENEKPTEEILKQVRLVKGVASAMPVIYGEGFLLSPMGGSEGVLIKGVDPDLVQKVLDIGKYVKKGAWNNFKDNSAILGASLAQNLDIEIDDPFTLVLNRGELSPFGLVPKMKKLRLIDTFHSGMTQYDSRHIYIPISAAEILFERKPRLIEVRTTDVRSIGQVKEALQAEIKEAVEVRDWLSENQDFLSALKLEKTVMAVILGLIILVASFNICGSLIMLVRDKTKDIAILKSMGAFDRTILKIFFFQGFFIGAVGTLIGAVLGVLMSLVLRDYIQFPLNKEVYMIDTLPVDLRFSDLILVVLGAFVISCVATLYPAYVASKIVPTEGLKAD